MRESPRQAAKARTAHGTCLREGLVALMVGAAFAGVAPPTRAAAGDAPPAASAADTSLEEVVVTARKRSESLRDIPASIVAISDSTIKESHMTQLDDLGSMVSNLNIFEAHDNSPAVTMRGVGAFELSQGVGFYMNDVQLYEGQTVRPVDIARIEVLKGPQGTLYGGANIGGAIKYVTKDPTPTWKNEVSLDLGQYRTANVAAVISGPIADKLGVRASVYDDNHDGTIFDPTHNRTLGKTHDKGGRFTFLAEPSAATNVRFSFNADDYNSENENLQYRVTELFGSPPQPYTADAYRRTVEDFFIPSFIRKLYSSSLQVDHQFADSVTLTSITSQFWSMNRGVTDFHKRPVPDDQLFQNIDNRVVSQELRLASSAHSSLDWLVGLLVQQHKTVTANSDLLWNQDPVNPAVDYGLTQNPNYYDYDHEDNTQKQFALFGDMTYYVGDWQYEFGLRVEEYRSSMNALYDKGLGAGLVTLAPQSLSGTKASPRLSVQYKASAATNVYATVARGFQPGSESYQLFSITPIRPETATSYELGVKSRLAHGAQFTAAVFMVDYKDRLYQQLSMVSGSIQDITMNLGPSRNTGFEMDFQLPLTQEFRLNGGFGMTRAIWGNAQYADPQLNAIANPNVDPTIPIVYRNLSGMTAPFTPKYSGNLALDWNHEMGGGFKVGAKLEGSLIGESYWDPNDYARQKPYHMVNVGVHMDTADWTVIAHVSNLTGTQYNTMYWDSVDAGTPHSFARINRPRTFVASATYRF